MQHSISSSIINTSYQKSPFGSGEYSSLNLSENSVTFRSSYQKNEIHNNYGRVIHIDKDGRPAYKLCFEGTRSPVLESSR